MVSQLCLMCGSTLNCQTLFLGARPRYNLVVDEDVKKPTNQRTKGTALSRAVVNLIFNDFKTRSPFYSVDAICS